MVGEREGGAEDRECRGPRVGKSGDLSRDGEGVVMAGQRATLKGGWGGVPGVQEIPGWQPLMGSMQRMVQSVLQWLVQGVGGTGRPGRRLVWSSKQDVMLARKRMCFGD